MQSDTPPEVYQQDPDASSYSYTDDSDEGKSAQEFCIFVETEQSRKNSKRNEIMARNRTKHFHNAFNQDSFVLLCCCQLYIQADLYGSLGKI